MVLLVGLGVFLISPNELRQFSADGRAGVAAATEHESKTVDAKPKIDRARAERAD